MREFGQAAWNNPNLARRRRLVEERCRRRLRQYEGQVDLMDRGRRQQANTSTLVFDLAQVNERVLVVHQEYEQRKRDRPSGAW